MYLSKAIHWHSRALIQHNHSRIWNKTLNAIAIAIVLLVDRRTAIRLNAGRDGSGWDYVEWLFDEAYSAGCDMSRDLLLFFYDRAPTTSEYEHTQTAINLKHTYPRNEPVTWWWVKSGKMKAKIRKGLCKLKIDYETLGKQEKWTKSEYSSGRETRFKKIIQKFKKRNETIYWNLLKKHMNECWVMRNVKILCGENINRYHIISEK